MYLAGAGMYRCFSFAHSRCEGFTCKFFDVCVCVCVAQKLQRSDELVRARISTLHIALLQSFRDGGCLGFSLLLLLRHGDRSVTIPRFGFLPNVHQRSLAGGT